MTAPAATATPALRACELTKRYGAKLALAGVSLAVAPGTAFGLVGANGAGKTTLLKCALDHCAPDAGRVEFFGVPASEPRARARLVYLPERFSPPHYMRGREFLAMTAALAGERFERARAEWLLAELELEADVLERPARQLSKGMTQKLGLAGCLLPRKDLYLFDEPMSGLDPAGRVAVKAILARLNREGRTLFFTSHVLADVEEVCSAIAVLDRGRVRFAGAPRALRERYGEPTLERAFLACLRDHDGRD
ncbi:MAG: ABC transporter ATP-binding protein [Burkholderiales bacterium]|nr:ABC transporter ATP-binding protein [Burkholderiales bacterium]